jgi:hypothetical protein
MNNHDFIQIRNRDLRMFVRYVPFADSASQIILKQKYGKTENRNS